MNGIGSVSPGLPQSKRILANPQAGKAFELSNSDELTPKRETIRATRIDLPTSRKIDSYLEAFASGAGAAPSDGAGTAGTSGAAGTSDGAGEEGQGHCPPEREQVVAQQV